MNDLTMWARKNGSPTEYTPISGTATERSVNAKWAMVDVTLG